MGASSGCIAISFFALAGCAFSPSEIALKETSNISRVKLERSVCLGTCPDYSVEIFGDGTVIYQGNQFVRAKGQHVYRISSLAAEALMSKFRKADLWSLSDSYIAPMTDNPEYRLSFTDHGNTKSIIDYVGSDVGMPPIVRYLELDVDRVADTQRWMMK